MYTLKVCFGYASDERRIVMEIIELINEILSALLDSNAIMDSVKERGKRRL